MADQLRAMREYHRYLRGLRSWVGFRQIGVPVERSERLSGSSQYRLSSPVRFASDAILASSIVPIRAAALLGLCGIGFTFLLSVYALAAKFSFQRTVPGWTSLVLVVSFLSGMLLLFLGIIGEYVGRIYEEVKGRPLYLIGRTAEAGSTPRSETVYLKTQSNLSGSGQS